jgi:hypothetical protein
VALEYDEYLVGFAIDDYDRAEVGDDERRNVARARLHATARRRGLALRFRPGPGRAMIFCVVALPVAAPTPAPAAVQRDKAAQRNSSSHQGGLSTECYRESLPRWMREGGQGGRSGRWVTW